MSATLLTEEEWEQILRGQAPPPGQAPALGTIMDVLALAEAARKGRGNLSLADFRRLWAALLAAGGALHAGTVVVEALHQDCLAESLFDQSQGPSAVALWGEVVGTETTPARSVRRLILRPSNAHWWGADAYGELEGREDGENRRDG